MVDGQAARAVDLPDDGGLDVPLVDDGHELLELVGRDDGHHALLGLAHEDLPGGQGRVAQQHLLQVHVHAAVAVGGELGGGAGDAGGAQVLDAEHEPGAEQVQAALDEDLLHEGVAHLDAGALGGHAVLEGLGRQDGGPTDPVAAGARPEEHHLVAGAGGVGQVDVLMAQHAHAQGIDQRVLLVGGVELGLSADIGQPQGVAVGTHAGHHAVDDACGVGVVDGAEAQLVHDGHGSRPHGDDVAHDPAHAGGGPLVGLDVAGVVVRLDLVGHGPAVTDVDDAGVLPHADQEVLAHLWSGLGPELAQVDLGGLVGAVLGPHDRVHGQLGVRGAPAQQLADGLVLVSLEPQLLPRHLPLGSRGGIGNGVGVVGWDRGLGRHGCSWSKRECGRAKPTRAPTVSHLTTRSHHSPWPAAVRARSERRGIRPKNIEKWKRGATPTLKVLRLTRFRGKIMA